MAEHERDDLRYVTDGARALRAYLRDIGQSVPSFCEEHELDRIMVQRALNGERRRISVDFAAAIERATGGRVPWIRWRSETATEQPRSYERPKRVVPPAADSSPRVTDRGRARRKTGTGG